MIEVTGPDFHNPPAYRNDDTHSYTTSFKTHDLSSENQSAHTEPMNNGVGVTVDGNGFSFAADNL